MIKQSLGPVFIGVNGEFGEGEKLGDLRSAAGAIGVG